MGVRKRECPCIYNRESSYDLLIPVRTVRVVRGSCFSTEVSAVILTAKGAKTAKVCLKRSVPSRHEVASGRIFPPPECRILRGISPEWKKTKKGVSPVDYREIRENRESSYDLLIPVRAVRVVCGS